MNIPIYTLRKKFHRNYHFYTSTEFYKIVQENKLNGLIPTPYFIWNSRIDDLYTFIVQECILGIESYVKGAVHIELGKRGRIKENYKYFPNPYSIPGPSGTVNKFYKLLPLLIGEEFSLEKNKKLWEETKKFYKFIRNPLFHGNKFGKISYTSFVEILNYMVDIYEWIDSWHNSEEFSNGSNYFTKFKR